MGLTFSFNLWYHSGQAAWFSIGWLLCKANVMAVDRTCSFGRICFALLEAFQIRFLLMRLYPSTDYPVILKYSVLSPGFLFTLDRS